MGTARLEYILRNKRKRLMGTYFNTIGNTGNIDYVFECNNLRHGL
jgi:hypothetical protein